MNKRRTEMAIKLNGITKHGGNIFPPVVSIAFADEHAEDYCIRMGWAEATDEEPVIEYPEGSFVVDPLTVFADGDQKGQHVMPHLAEAHLASQEQAEASPPAEQEG
jgi:hypothetical protein